ncbi:hypothetical protein QTP86_022610, partial [Hemibagrus guttatus]
LSPASSIRAISCVSNQYHITTEDVSRKFSCLHPDGPQYVRLQNTISDIIVSSTGAPQEKVLSPLLFTPDFRHCSQSCHLQKFSDDVLGCIRRAEGSPSPISIMGTEVYIVDNYKYLGIHIDNKLEWTKNSDALYEKGQSHL